jgi:hypothetical protein
LNFFGLGDYEPCLGVPTTLYVKRQTPGKEKFYGIRQLRVNEFAILKLKYIIILSTQERKYETKTFNKILPRKFEPAVCRSWKREA